jgi:GDP-L-fucose synthase
VNLGSGMEISHPRPGRDDRAVTGYQGDIVWDTSKPNGQPRRQLDVSRAEDYFGFHATTPFAEGLQRTVDWYRSSVGM